MSEMLRNLFSKPVTTRYPAERVPIPDGFRGRVGCADDRCIGCSKCSLVCPASAITMVDSPRMVEFKGRTLERKKRPSIALYQCIRCGLCERHCPADAIHLRNGQSINGSTLDEVVTCTL
ncbi:MAG: 4Fe-4S dicluster domain-containing protein [Methanospirillum sp.]|nr:4Fe-4S dicluster domain-containing protein [Methanospirillum sp.]